MEIIKAIMAIIETTTRTMVIMVTTTAITKAIMAIIITTTRTITRIMGITETVTIKAEITKGVVVASKVVDQVLKE